MHSGTAFLSLLSLSENVYIPARMHVILFFLSNAWNQENRTDERVHTPPFSAEGVKMYLSYAFGADAESQFEP